VTVVEEALVSLEFFLDVVALLVSIRKYTVTSLLNFIYIVVDILSFIRLLTSLQGGTLDRQSACGGLQLHPCHGSILLAALALNAPCRQKDVCICPQ